MKIKLFWLTLIVGIISIFGMTEVSAEEYNKWDEVYTKFSEFTKEDGITLTKTDNEINISLTNTKYGAYSMKMTYQDNKLSYINDRDVSSANDETKIYYSDNDLYFLGLMVCSMFDAYKIDPSLISDEGGFFANGIKIDYGKQIEISKEVNGATVTRTGSPINSFTIDFKSFFEQTEDVQNTLDKDSEENINLVVTLFKVLVNPLDDNVWKFDGSISDKVEDEMNKVEDEQTPSNENSVNNKNTNTVEKTNEKNPETGFELPIFLVGALITLAGTLIIIRKKNLFQNI